jgi:Uma2 family endonuclease
MKQPEFHRAYEAMPENYRAELIGGIVFEPSPVGFEHMSNDARLIGLLDYYAALTPGVDAGCNGTVILGEEDEVQPDVLLRIQPERGGQSRNTTKASGASKKKQITYVAGPPELVAEIAHSSRAIDLHLKKDRYALAGVLEYVVLCLDPLVLYWFDLQHNKKIIADAAGIVKSTVFHGLWIDVAALLELNGPKSIKVLTKGMNSAAYRKFAASLAERT